MIIAEIGINHGGCEKTATEMLNNLLKTSIDAITFQIPDQEYLDSTEPKRRPLTKNFYIEAIDKTHRFEKLIGFACGDIKMIEFLDACGADFWKTLSWDILNGELQSKLQKTSKLTFISTGVSDINDIIEASQKYSNIRFVHTQISNEIKDVNLKAIKTIHTKTNSKVAFGLHCSEKEVIYISLAYGPSDILFYVKNSFSNNYPDGIHAIPLSEIERTINNINKFKNAIGNGDKLAIERKWE